VLSTSDAITDWKEYLFLCLSLVLTTSCACRTFICLFHFKGMADPFWNGSDVLSLAKHLCRLQLLCTDSSALYYMGNCNILLSLSMLLHLVFLLSEKCLCICVAFDSEGTSLLYLTHLKHSGCYVYHLL
jgi:hypothetical protein